ncbi:MAG: rhodanese-like domain-containing protein [Bacteroidota bacterium]|nr:rhodanese-like domain-containing protein [Bacteroidota bacterium]
MKMKLAIVALVLFSAGVLLASKTIQQKVEPWKPSQLIEPADLAKTIQDPQAKKPVIISVGPGAVIKGSIDMGMASNEKNLAKLKELLSKYDKNTNIVIYCGCCPFVHCPNIRPAFSLLNEMQFTNHKLLDLSTNVKVDWINKGYPLNQ